MRWLQDLAVPFLLLVLSSSASDPGTRVCNPGTICATCRRPPGERGLDADCKELQDYSEAIRHDDAMGLLSAHLHCSRSLAERDHYYRKV